MKRLNIFTILITLFFISTLSIIAQPVHDWTVTTGGDSGLYNERGMEIFTDDAGYVYAQGYFGGTANFGRGNDSFFISSQYEEYRSCYIAKYDSLGQNIWALPIDFADDFRSTWEDTNMSMVVSPGGDVYVLAVNSNPLADLDPGPGIVTPDSTHQSNLIKYNTHGEFLWVKELDFFEYSNIVLDDDENIIIAGQFFHAADFDPSPNVDFNGTVEGGSYQFLAKYDLNGNYTWGMAHKVEPAPPQTFSAVGFRKVDIDSYGDIYIHCNLNGMLDLDPGIDTFLITVPFGAQCYLAKYTSEGHFVYAHIFDSVPQAPNHASGIRNIKIDHDDNIVVTGNFDGPFDFDFSENNHILETDPELEDSYNYIAKYTNDAELIWAYKMSEFGNLTIDGVAFDRVNNIYLTGRLATPMVNVDLDPGLGIVSPELNAYSDIYIAKYTPSFEYEWSFNFGGGFPWALGQEQGYDITLDNNDNIYGTGSFNWTADFDPSPCVYNRTATEDGLRSDVFIAKYTQNCNASNFPILESLRNSLCIGESIEIEVVNFNELYSGNYWFLYENTCGGTVIDSSEFGPFVVNPMETTTYYVVGQGCCFNELSCDSITIEVLDAVNNSFEELEICEGDSILIFGNYESIPQVYTDNFTTADGCDSLHSIELLFNAPQTFAEETVCFGDSILIFGNYETEPQIYSEVFTSDLGCDSIHSIQLFNTTLLDLVSVEGDSLIAIQGNATYQWYDCITGLPILNAIDRVFVPEVAGTYYVVVSAEGCEVISDCVDFEIVSSSSTILLSQLKIYPNPFNEIVYIENEFIGESLKFEIIGIDGKIFRKGIINDPKTEIDLSSLYAGVYYVRLETELNSWAIPLIKI